MGQKASVEQKRQKPSVPLSILTTEQQPSVPSLILTIPEELFTLITLFMGTESHLALASTCKMLDNYYKQCYKEETFTLIYDPQFKTSLYSEYIKALEHRLGQTGWMRKKVTIITASVNSQNSYNYPVKALYLKKPFEVPNGLDCATVDTLILEFSSEEKQSLS